MPALRNRIEQLERSFPEVRPLSEYDRDALELYRFHCYLDATMEPDYEDLARTAPFARGRELAELAQGKKEYEFESVCNESWAARHFKSLFGRKPESGDLLHFKLLQIKDELRRSSKQDFIAAWLRRLPNLPCPLKYEGQQLMKRIMQRPTGRSPHNPPWPNWPIVWEKYRDLFSAEREWYRIEKEAGLGPSDAEGKYELDDSKLAPRIFAVLFIDGDHCRPATEEEIAADHTEPAEDSIVGILSEQLQRMQDEKGTEVQA